MASVAHKLSRLAALKPVKNAVPVRAEFSAPEEHDELARILGARVAHTTFGKHLSVTQWHGTPEPVEPSQETIELLSQNKDSRKRMQLRDALSDPRKWLFLDTETTGLAGGTGTYAFLVGIAWWDAGGLQVEQMVMRDFGEEHSVLQELDARLRERPVLVTFNGKSFDWPLLESRFTMTRSIRPPQLLAHLDLLHPARALWKFRLGSVRLVELERHVLDAPRLGWHRNNDVPSAMIPQFYFDYLRGGPAEPLAGVVKHNEMDLRGLAALFGKINSLLTHEERENSSFHSLDLFGLSRYLQRFGESEKAERNCSRALLQGLPAEERGRARWDLALMAKRRGEYSVAAEIWKTLLAENCEIFAACEQLAIHYERREKDLARAEEVTKLALMKIRSGAMRLNEPYATSKTAQMEARFQKRLVRLQLRNSSAGKSRQKALLA